MKNLSVYLFDERENIIEFFTDLGEMNKVLKRKKHHNFIIGMGQINLFPLRTKKRASSIVRFNTCGISRRKDSYRLGKDWEKVGGYMKMAARKHRKVESEM